MESLDNVYKAVESRSFNITNLINEMCTHISRGRRSEARTIFMEQLRVPLSRPDVETALLPLLKEEYTHLKHIERFNPTVEIIII